MYGSEQLVPVDVHIKADDTRAPEKPCDIVGSARSFNIRLATSGDQPQCILAHNPNRVRAYISPFYGTVAGIVWLCNSLGDAQDLIGYPLNAFYPNADALESLATTELWAVADPANTAIVQVRVWTEVKQSGA